MLALQTQEVLPLALEPEEPAGHAVHTLAPAAEKVLAPQSEHDDEAAAGENEPAGQALQVEPPPESALPAAHVHVSEAPPPAAVKPAAQLQDAEPAAGATALGLMLEQSVQLGAVIEVAKDSAGHRPDSRPS